MVNVQQENSKFIHVPHDNISRCPQNCDGITNKHDQLNIPFTEDKLTFIRNIIRILAWQEVVAGKRTNQF